MTIETLAFIFGALLILIGLLGGGFEAKEIRIPRVSGTGRLVFVVVGMSFVVLGFWFRPSPPSPVVGPPEVNKERQPSIHFTIQDEMSKRQIAERYRGQTVVHIDGRMVGTITVDPSFPKSSITVTLPSKGKSNYVLEAAATWIENGKAMEIHCIGEGSIDSDTGKVFKIEGRWDPKSNKCILWLKELR